jgi:hypothetical protein
MVSKCANPECGRPFKYLRDGQIFVCDRGADEPRGIQSNLIEKVLFLCADCARTHAIIDNNGYPLLVPMKKENRFAARRAVHGDVA